MPTQITLLSHRILRNCAISPITVDILLVCDISHFFFTILVLLLDNANFVPLPLCLIVLVLS